MTLKDFIQLFKESFDEDPGAIEGSTRFKEMELWTSMQALILIAHIDDTINVVLEAEDISQSATLEELHSKLLDRMS